MKWFDRIVQLPENAGYVAMERAASIDPGVTEPAVPVIDRYADVPT